MIIYFLLSVVLTTLLIWGAVHPEGPNLIMVLIGYLGGALINLFWGAFIVLIRHKPISGKQRTPIRPGEPKVPSTASAHTPSSSLQSSTSVQVKIKVSDPIHGSSDYMGTFDIVLSLDLKADQLLNRIAKHVLWDGEMRYYSGYQLNGPARQITSVDIPSKTLRTIGVNEGDILEFIDRGGQFTLPWSQTPIYEEETFGLRPAHLPAASRHTASPWQCHWWSCGSQSAARVTWFFRRQRQ